LRAKNKKKEIKLTIERSEAELPNAHDGRIRGWRNAENYLV
jgi:hypothetical protein